MRKFINIHEERQQIEEAFLNLSILPDHVAENIRRVVNRSGIVAVQRVLVDVFESGIRFVGRNPLKTAFAILALDQLANNQRGTQALIRYLEGPFGKHAALVVDALQLLIENGFKSGEAADIVTELIK